MNVAAAATLGVVEGLTEFLPVSSTGHLTVAEKLLGLPVNDPGVTAFTAIIQLGAIAAVLLFFWRDLSELAVAWWTGLRDPARRGESYRLAWLVIVGSAPIGVVGFIGKDAVTAVRNLWIVAAGLIGWSAVMVAAERYGRQNRRERQARISDGVVMGLVQCLALIPGVSRSGATISAGLMRGMDRVSATRLSFFLSIPALAAAGSFEAATEASNVGETVGWTATAVGVGVAFVVGYASIAWLLRLVARRSIAAFVPYRVAAGVVIVLALTVGALAAT